MGIVPFGIQSQYNKKILQNGFSIVAEDPHEDCQDSDRTKELVNLERLKRETARQHDFGPGGPGIMPVNYNGETSDDDGGIARDVRSGDSIQDLKENNDQIISAGRVQERDSSQDDDAETPRGTSKKTNFKAEVRIVRLYKDKVVCPSPVKIERVGPTSELIDEEKGFVKSIFDDGKNLKDMSDAEHMIKYYFDGFRQAPADATGLLEPRVDGEGNASANGDMIEEKHEAVVEDDESIISESMGDSIQEMSSDAENDTVIDAKLPIIKEIMLCLESSANKAITGDQLRKACRIVSDHHQLPDKLYEIVLASHDGILPSSLCRSDLRQRLADVVPAINQLISSSKRQQVEHTTTDKVIQQLEYKGTNEISE